MAIVNQQMPCESVRPDESYGTERASCEVLDMLLEQNGCFKVYSECRGRSMHPQPYSPDSSYRIDRILVPTMEAAIQGWRYGAIGIEAKSGDHSRNGSNNTGKFISQALDYSRAIWDIGHPAGIQVYAPIIFLWPFDKPSASIASVMAQNRIGVAKYNRYGPGITLNIGQTPVAELLRGEILMRAGSTIDVGIKVGSR